MRSKPYELCAIFKTLHEANTRYGGRPYIISGHDLKEAKVIVDLNEWEELLSIVEPCFSNYIESNFDGWREQGHPAWGLFTQWGRYLPKVKPKPRPLMIRCSTCGEAHEANAVCQTKED